MKMLSLNLYNKLVLGLVLPFVILFFVALPTQLAMFNHLVFIAVCASSVFLNLFYLKKFMFKKIDFLYLCLTLLIIGSLFRTLFAGIIQSSSITLLIIKLCLLAANIFFAFKNTSNHSDNRQILRYLCYLLICYVAMNFILFVLGIQNRTQSVNGGELGVSSLMSLIGIAHERVLFFLAQGFQSFGFIIGLLFIYNSFMNYRLPMLKVMISLVCLVVMILGDVRGALFISLISIASIYLLSRIYVRQLNIIVFSGFCIVIAGLILIVIGQASLDVVSRDGATVLSGREIIWFFTIAELSETSLFNLITGYGAWSQAISGVSDNYSFIFSNWANPELASYHNAYLQVLMDIGLLGVVIYFVILKDYLSVLSYELYSDFHNKYFKLHLAVIIYYVLFGLFDINLLFYNQMAFYIFSLHIFMVGCTKSKALLVTVK